MRASTDIFYNEFSSYMSSIQHLNPLSREEEASLSVAWLDRQDQNALNKLVQHNLKFVAKTCMKYKRPTDPGFMDMLQCGNEGLMVAAKKFDPSLGYKLITYAVYQIRTHINKYLSETTSPINMCTSSYDRRFFHKKTKLGEIIEEKNEEKKEELRDQLASSMKFKKKFVLEAEEKIKTRFLSLDAPIPGSDEDNVFHSIIADDSINQEDLCIDSMYAKDITRLVQKSLTKLTPRERHLVEEYYFGKKTLQQLGTEYGLSRERIRQINKIALKKIRTSMDWNKNLLRELELTEG